MSNTNEIASKVLRRIKEDRRFEKVFEENPAKAIENVSGMLMTGAQLDSVIKNVKSRQNHEFDFDELMDKDKVPGVSGIGKLLD